MFWLLGLHGYEPCPILCDVGNWIQSIMYAVQATSPFLPPFLNREGIVQFRLAQICCVSRMTLNDPPPSISHVLGFCVTYHTQLFTFSFLPFVI